MSMRREFISNAAAAWNHVDRELVTCRNTSLQFDKIRYLRNTKAVAVRDVKVS